jgi:polyphenol oxidase
VSTDTGKSESKDVWIEADWPAPSCVRTASTWRTGGVSTGAYASCNLGSHVGDDPAAVAQNRSQLCAQLRLDHEPLWLNQVHGTVVVDAGSSTGIPTADAAIAHGPQRACVVLTADCLPVLLCDRQGLHVAAAHAGWRGLAAGVLTATVAALGVEPANLIAWLGPAIEQDAFEVGPEVRQAFLADDQSAAAAFAANERGRWQADLYQLAHRALARLGVREVYGGEARCFADADRYFSYRRDGRTGRMATMIWIV